MAVHRLVGDVAAGEIASTRLAAGTGWDLRARGPIADAVAWATERGSVGYGVGLGRLLQRAGEAWQERQDHDRAALVYSMALPLLSLAGGVLPATILDALATVDLDRNFVARALVRLEQTFRALPPMRPLDEDPTGWMSQARLVMSMTKAQSDRAVGSEGLVGLTGLERAVERLRELLAVPGVPSTDGAGGSLRDAPSRLDELAAGFDVDDILSGASAQHLTALTAHRVRDQIATMTAMTQLHRARLARRAGWTGQADRWFSAALASIDAGAPNQRWVGVLVCAAWDRVDEARARYEEARAEGSLPDDLLGGLAMRAQAYEDAQALYDALDAERDEPPSWEELTDRAELALETGDAGRTRLLATAAIEGFEAIVGTLGRDPDRVTLCDDPQTARLYFVAARAWLATAAGEAPSEDAVARSFEMSDRGRSLALAGLIAGVGRAAPDDDALGRRWQQASTEWSAAFERVLAAYEADDALMAQDRLGVPVEDLTRADDALVALEADIESRRPGTIAGARALPPPPDVKAVQRALPPGACVVQYHVVERDLVIWTVTADRLQAVQRRLDVPGVEPLVAAVWRGCANGRPGVEADRLAELLLSPVAETLRECARVVVVPFGPLTAVPFHAIPFDGAPLGEGRVISFLPSASLLVDRRLDAELPGRDALAVGDPAFDGATHPTLRRLPGALVEAQAVARIWGTDDVLVGDGASESAVRRRLPGRTIVHLAAHGHLDEIAPSASALVLARAERLTVSDLIGMRVDADLAVLSACDTGRGKATLGGDVVGLTRGFLAAGVRGAVVSLWPVDDVAACVTMAALHESLAAGTAPAQALAAAHETIRAMSAAQVGARYAELGGTLDPLGTTIRRGGGTPVAPEFRPIPLDPEFLDTDESTPEPLASLDGGLERVWAPFILVGV